MVPSVALLATLLTATAPASGAVNGSVCDALALLCKFAPPRLRRKYNTPPGQEGVYGWDVRLGAISRNLPQSPVTSSGPGAWEEQG